MNRQEFEDTARRYREELFRMYANQSMDPPPKPAPAAQEPPAPAAQPVSQPSPPEPPQPDIPPQPAPEPQPNPPAPALEPEQPSAEQPEAPQPHVPKKRPYTGYIRVHVTTAEGARPVPGATVMITRMQDGEPELVSLQSTDASGNTQTVPVPAPPPSADQRHPESYIYDVSVQAHDFYREHSTDVPVFPNITSMQNFNLIPLPAGADEPMPDGDITYYNNMQQY